MTYPAPIPHAQGVQHLCWAPLTGWRWIRANPGHEELPGGRVVRVVTGLRAYRWDRGRVSLFRPRDYAGLIRRACRERCMPVVPASLLLAAAEEAVRRADRIPGGALDSLHLTVELREEAPGPGQRRYCCRLRPVIEPYADQLLPITLQIDHAVAGLETTHHPFFVFGDSRNARVFSPVLSDGPTIARDTVEQLSRMLGFPLREANLGLHAWRELIEKGVVREAFACSAAPLVAPVAVVESPVGKMRVGDGQPGYVTINIRRAMARLVHGAMRDALGWSHLVQPPLSTRRGRQTGRLTTPNSLSVGVGASR
ncbi:hypothetical protein ACGFIR_31270 [Micromonospora sp. NPDC049051]|uniref:hypothetical protein n=1 Tax=Micromonospora sp. NPDC049051 TaxID=3364264 RepID=UPI00371A12B4